MYSYWQYKTYAITNANLTGGGKYFSYGIDAGTRIFVAANDRKHVSDGYIKVNHFIFSPDNYIGQVGTADGEYSSPDMILLTGIRGSRSAGSSLILTAGSIIWL